MNGYVVVIALVMVITFTVWAITYWTSNKCFKEETCNRANILGEWAEDENGRRDRSGCILDTSDNPVCVCKQQYGGTKCDVEVCTPQLREMCNGGVAVPENEIGSAVSGECKVASPNGLIAKCECTEAWTPSGGSAEPPTTNECNVEKSTRLPTLSDQSLIKSNSVYKGITVQKYGDKETCDYVNCDDAVHEDGSSKGRITDITTAATHNKLLPLWSKKYGTGHIFVNKEYETQRELDVVNAIIQSNCVLETSNSGADATIPASPEDGVGIGITDLTAQDITNVTERLAGATTASSVCNYHNSDSYIQMRSKNVPIGECVFVDESTNSDYLLMKLILKNIEYLYLSFEADDAIYGPISPHKILAISPAPAGGFGASTMEGILQRGVNVNDSANYNVHLLTEEKKAELCNGCWTFGSEMADAVIGDEGLGNSPSRPITFVRTRNAAGDLECLQVTNSNHYSYWKSKTQEGSQGEKYCAASVCTLDECCGSNKELASEFTDHCSPTSTNPDSFIWNGYCDYDITLP